MATRRHIVGLLTVVAIPCAAAQSSRPFVFEYPRPVMQAAVTLEHRYGAVINYEDPPYAYHEDLVDMTKVEIEGVPRAISPRWERIVVPEGLPGPAEGLDPTHILQRVLDLHGESLGSAPIFGVRRDGNILTVLPLRVRDADGRWVPVRPVLDATITLPSGTFTLTDFVDVLCRHVTDATGVRIAPGNLRSMQAVEVVSTTEPARQVLRRGLDASGFRLSWRLLYDPARQRYVLNVGPPGNPGLVVKDDR